MFLMNLKLLNTCRDNDIYGGYKGWNKRTAHSESQGNFGVIVVFIIPIDSFISFYFCSVLFNFSFSITNLLNSVDWDSAWEDWKLWWANGCCSWREGWCWWWRTELRIGCVLLFYLFFMSWYWFDALYSAVNFFVGVAVAVFFVRIINKTFLHWTKCGRFSSEKAVTVI